MEYKNITLNGLKIPLPEKSRIKDVIEKFFDSRCEFLVSINSKPIPNNKLESFSIKENDKIQIITYCKKCYKLNKRSFFKTENNNDKIN